MNKVLLPIASVSLLLAGCNSATPPQASDQPTVVTIGGQVASPSGAGKVSLPDMASVSTSTATDGSFSLTLPQAAALSGKTMTAAQVMAGLKCTGSLNSSDAAAQGYVVAALNVQDNAGSRQVYALNGSKTGLLSRAMNGKIWLYSDRATILSGSVDCADLLGVTQIKSLPVTVAVAAKAGWNVVDLSLSASADIFANVSASGNAVNSTTSTAATTWRTLDEVRGQLGF